MIKLNFCLYCVLCVCSEGADMHSLGHMVQEWCWLSSGSLSPRNPPSFLPASLPVGSKQQRRAMLRQLWPHLAARMRPGHHWSVGCGKGRLHLCMEVRHMDASSMQHAECGFWAEGVHDSRTMTLNQQISKNEMLQLFLIPIVLFWEISWSNFNHMENEPASCCKVPLQISNLHQKQQGRAKTFTENMSRKVEPMLYHILSYLFTTGLFSYNGWVEKNKKFDCRNSLVKWGERLLTCLLVVIFLAEVDVKVNLRQKVSQQEHVCENHSYQLITEILVAA